MPPKKAESKKTASDAKKSGKKSSTDKKTDPKVEIKDQVDDDASLVEDAKVADIAPPKEVSNDSNLVRVNFTAPSPKDIISMNSGSILASTEPVVPLTTVQREKIAKIFNDNQGSDAANTMNLARRIPRSKLAEILIEFGFDAPKNELENCIRQFYNEAQDFDEAALAEFIERFQAPPYHYGQRLRFHCSRGHLSKVIELIIRGCNPNTGDGNGLSALHYAAQYNRPEIIQAMNKLCSMMKSTPLNINNRDKAGWTPLHTAAHHGSNESVKILLDLKANVNIANDGGKTPLHIAASQARNTICEMLINSGAIINTKDKYGMTPLHASAFNAHDRTYFLLCKVSGADQSLVDRLGNPPNYYMENSMVAGDCK